MNKRLNYRLERIRITDNDFRIDFDMHWDRDDVDRDSQQIDNGDDVDREPDSPRR